MFMTFTLIDQHYRGEEYEAPIGARDAAQPLQKICINVNSIESLQQSGRWEQQQLVPEPAPMVEIDPRLMHDPREWDVPHPFDAPRRPPGPVARRRDAGARPQRRIQEIFIMHMDRFIIQMKNGHSHTVLGKFEEMAEVLGRFKDKLETV